MKKLLLFFAIIITIPLYAQSDSMLLSGSFPEILNGRKIFKITKADSKQYKNPDFDHSNWDSISLPYNESEYEFSKNEKQIYWYRLIIEFPKQLPEKEIGISLGKISDIDATYFNGVLIGTSGSFKENKHASNKTRIYSIPSHLIKPGEKNVLAIRVKNTYRADEMPGRGDYRIDYFERLIRNYYVFGFFQLFFCIIYISIAMLFMLIFFKRRKGSSSLIFSIFLIVLAIYTFTRLDIKYVFFDSFDILQRIEFSSLYVLLPVFMAFILKYFDEKRRIIHYIFFGLSLVFTISALVISDHLLRYKINVYVVQFTWAIPLLTWIYVLAKKFKTNREARLMTFSTIFIVSGILHDTLLSRGIQILPDVSIWLSPFAFFLFVISMAAIITGRHAQALREIEDLNKNLEAKVKSRTFELNEALQRIQEKDLQIEKELQIAGGVQRSLLPSEVPNWNNIGIALRHYPLREVSGDFYDFIEFQDGGKGILLGDASGHGMPAALYTILAKTAISKALFSKDNPTDIYKMTNDILCDVETDLYFTSFFVKIADENKILYSNAGHTKTLLIQKNKKKLVFLDTEGTFVGAMKDASETYQSKETEVVSGDKLILYTDCLIESTTKQGAEYGKEGLISSVKNNFDSDIDDLIQAIDNDFRENVKFEDIKDDLTIIGIEIK